MLVIEDVTNFEIMEQEVIKSQLESELKVKRMQEIVSNTKRELRVFIREANLNLEGAKKSIIDNDFEKFFMATHTLKGNSRIYNLSSLSNHIHIIEERLVRMKKADKNEREEGLKECFEDLEDITLIYIDLSKEIFGQDVDETVVVGDEDYLEIEKELFFGTLAEVKAELKRRVLVRSLTN